MQRASKSTRAQSSKIARARAGVRSPHDDLRKLSYFCARFRRLNACASANTFVQDMVDRIDGVGSPLSMFNFFMCKKKRNGNLPSNRREIPIGKTIRSKTIFFLPLVLWEIAAVGENRGQFRDGRGCLNDLSRVQGAIGEITSGWFI